MKKVYLSIQLVKLHHLQVLELRPILEDMSQVKHSFGDGPFNLVLLSDLPDITRYYFRMVFTPLWCSFEIHDLLPHVVVKI